MITMTEPTTEQKIELLVRSVLEAVDARLDTVRHEMAVSAAEADRRHHDVLAAIADLDERLTAMADSSTISRPELDALARDVAELRSSVAPSATVRTSPPPDPATTTGSHPVLPESFEELSRPIVTHITTQVPIVPEPSHLDHPSGYDHEGAEHAPHLPLTVPPPVAPHFHDEPPVSPAPDDGEEQGDGGIDLDQLTSLLTERLGSLSLPVPTDD